MKRTEQLALALGAVDRGSGRHAVAAAPRRAIAAAEPPVHRSHVLETQERPIGGFLKRAFDVLFAASALVMLAPVMATIALGVRLHDGGPIFYGHARVGRGGRMFKCLKFRSMAKDSQALLDRHLAANPAAAAEWRRTFKLRDDPRITPIGKFIRKTSLDELPQLLNILRGEMSVVGPRPVVSDELDRYRLARIHYLRARPGLTGLWQVSGRNETSYEERIHFDKRYVLEWSLIGDIAIVLKTVPALLLARGVY